MTNNEKKRLLITGIAAQQVYAHCHDEAIGMGVFRQDLKMSSKNLVSKLERDLIQVFKTMGTVNNGDVYIGVLQVMENVFKDLAELPLEYWYMVGTYIREIKELSDEKIKEEADRESNGNLQTDVPNDGAGDTNNSEPERVEGETND